MVAFDLRQVGGSALTSEIEVPKAGVGDDIPVTYVPARNTIFLSFALGWAEVLGAYDIFIGVNAWTIPVTLIAALNISTPTSGWPIWPPRPGWREPGILLSIPFNQSDQGRDYQARHCTGG